MGHQASNDLAALDKLYDCLLASARRGVFGTSCAFSKIEEIFGESFWAVVEFIPDYEHAAAQCSGIDLVADYVKADLAGQGGRDAVQAQLQSMSGARSECYITMYLDKASQRIDKPRPLRKFKGGYLQEAERWAKVMTDNSENPLEDPRHSSEGAGWEPLNLQLNANKARRLMDSQRSQHPKPALINYSKSLKTEKFFSFDELYQLCEKNFPELLHIGGFSFCRNLQIFSSLGHELKVGEAGKESDLVRISYVVTIDRGEVEEMAWEMVCAADGLPDFSRMLEDITRTIEAAIAYSPGKTPRVNLQPSAGPRIIPLESKAQFKDTAHVKSWSSDRPHMGLEELLQTPSRILRTGVVRRSRAIYWSPNQPPEDVKAQIIVALIQFRLLRDCSPFIRWLERYVLQNFKVRTRSEDRKTAARDAVSTILNHHGLTEDFRSWRKYVHFYLDRASRDLASSAINPEDVPDPRSDSSDAESMGDSAAPVGAWSVADCARELGISWQWANSLVRGLVRKGKLIPLQTNPMRIAESHVGMLVRGRNQRVREQRSRLRKRKKLEQQGMSFEAARKAINRKRGRLPAILKSNDKSEG